MIVTASEKAMEIVKQQTPQASNPTEQLTQLVTTAKSLGIMGAPSSGFTLESFLGLLGSPLLKPLIDKFLTPVDPIAQLTGYLTLFDKLQNLRGDSGGSGGAPKDWKAAIVTDLVPRIPEILDGWAKNNQAAIDAATQRRIAAEATERAAGTIRTLQAPGAQSQQTAPQPAHPPHMQAAPPAPAASGLRTVRLDAGVPNVTVSAAQPGPPLPTVVQPSPSEADAIANFVKSRVVAIIRAGGDPEEIAEHIVDFLEDSDPETVKQLVSVSGEMLTAVFSGDPILKAAVAHPQWKEILEAAREYILEGVQVPVGASTAPN